jgi:hypothetical protein
MIYNEKQGATGRLLIEQPFWSLYGDLTSLRIDGFMRMMEAQKKKGRILPFIRGLYFSSHLIYAVREYLSGSGLSVSWGHLLDKTEDFCSAECDIIIHQKGWLRQWNGKHKDPVMDFRFIPQEWAVAVISCKSHLRTGDIDEEYCKLLKPYVKKIWLFSECCGPHSVDSIKRKATRCGYGKCWHLYTWSKQTAPNPNSEGWNDFVREVKRLAR